MAPGTDASLGLNELTDWPLEDAAEIFDWKYKKNISTFLQQQSIVLYDWSNIIHNSANEVLLPWLLIIFSLLSVTSHCFQLTPMTSADHPASAHVIP